MKNFLRWSVRLYYRLFPNQMDKDLKRVERFSALNPRYFTAQDLAIAEGGISERKAQKYIDMAVRRGGFFQVDERHYSI